MDPLHTVLNQESSVLSDIYFQLGCSLLSYNPRMIMMATRIPRAKIRASISHTRQAFNFETKPDLSAVSLVGFSGTMAVASSVCEGVGEGSRPSS